MIKRKLFGTGNFKTGKKVIASALALTMVASTAVYAVNNDNVAKAVKSVIVAAEATGSAVMTDLNGDIDGNGQVDLNDAQLALQEYLHIGNLTDEQKLRADVDGNGAVDLLDVQQILQAYLKIQPLPSKAPAPASEEPSKKPVSTLPVIPTAAPATKTPRPVLPTVEPQPENVVQGQQVQVKKLNGAQTDESGKGIVFGPMPTAGTGSALGVKAYGVEMENPFADRTDLQQTPEDAIRNALTKKGVPETVPITGAVVTGVDEDGEAYEKPTVWSLTGSSLKNIENVNLHADGFDYRVANAEPHGEQQFCKEDEIDYTLPAWEKGISYSFWLKSSSTSHGDPLLVLENDNFMLSIKMNGSARFQVGDTPENQLDLGSDMIDNGTFGEWTHYTVTIKNDWVQVYINGQENIYTSLVMDRAKIKNFNDGFLTRYNLVKGTTQEIMDNDIRKYYSKPLNGSVGKAAWVYDEMHENEDGEIEPAWVSNDDISIFVSGRFAGKGAGKDLLMDLMTDSETKLWIGGTVSNIGNTLDTARTLKQDDQVYDIKAYDKELTAEEVAACYEYDTQMPETDLVWDPSKQQQEESDEPSVTTDGSIKIKTVGDYATVSNDIVTFIKQPSDSVTDEAAIAERKKAKGVEYYNPFAEQVQLRETLEEALSGQSIFPYSVNKAGGTLEGEEASLGCAANATEVRRGNFYDVYYGDVDKLGNIMNPATGTNDVTAGKDTIYSEDALKTMYPDKQTTFQRPVWSKGASLSFWAKPTQVDDSPLITFYKAGVILLYVTVRGDVAYYNMDKYYWNGDQIRENNQPYNGFYALGDSSYVNADEWNYYTVTISNDWIQVYVNGKELVYTQVNLNRGFMKYFNAGYLTRYNTIGIWNTDMIQANGEPSGTTLEGTARNYLIKSGCGVYDMDAELTVENGGLDVNGNVVNNVLSDKGANAGKDGASIRMSGVYADPYSRYPTTTSMGDPISETTLSHWLLMDAFTEANVKLYVGGVKTQVAIDKKPFLIRDLVYDQETAEALGEEVHYAYPYERDDEGNDAYDDDGNLKVSRDAYCKTFFSDQQLDVGTQVTGLVPYMEELTAQQVQEEYAKAVKPSAE